MDIIFINTETSVLKHKDMERLTTGQKHNLRIEMNIERIKYLAESTHESIKSHQISMKEVLRNMNEIVKLSGTLNELNK